MNIKHLMALMVGAIAMATAVPAWSSLPRENPIDDGYYNMTHVPVINFTGMNLNYTPGTRSRCGSYFNGKFTGTSTWALTYKLIAPGYNNVSFKGTFSLMASITPAGTLSSGKFAFTSSDKMFGFGTTKVCDSRGRNCVQQPKTGVVFAADLNKFGWSSKKSMLEFQTYNLTGWVKTMGWTTPSERIWFNIPGGLDLSTHMQYAQCWSATKVSGTAVVPEPSTVLLLGSGFAGLLGFSRRKNTKKI